MTSFVLAADLSADWPGVGQCRAYRLAAADKVEVPGGTYQSVPGRRGGRKCPADRGSLRVWSIPILPELRKGEERPDARVPEWPGTQPLRNGLLCEFATNTFYLKSSKASSMDKR